MSRLPDLHRASAPAGQRPHPVREARTIFIQISEDVCQRHVHALERIVRRENMNIDHRAMPSLAANNQYVRSIALVAFAAALAKGTEAELVTGDPE